MRCIMKVAMPARCSRKLLTILLLLVLLLASYVADVITQPLATPSPTITFSFVARPQAVSLTWPNYGQAALGAVGYGVLATHGSMTPFPTASVIKILTALAVLKQQPLNIGQVGPTITLTQADVDSYNKYVTEHGSVVKVAVDEQLTERQALEALLLPSANNIAETIGRWAFGSLDAYNTFATSYAHQLGMGNTTVTDPSGFLASTVSTAQDLTVLGETALSNPIVAQIVNETSATIPVQGVIYNTNALLGRNGIIGIKTGNNDQDPGCYLVGANQQIGSQTITVVSTVMDGPNLATAMASADTLLQTATANFVSLPIVSIGTSLGYYHMPWQDPVSATAQVPLSLVVWKNSTTTATASLGNTQVPMKASSTIGKLIATNNASGTTTTIPIVLSKPVSKPSLVWRLLHPL